MEKQKPAAQYNITEQQLRNYLQKAVRRAQRIPDITSGDVLMQLLETHLDAVEMHAGLARTIHVARQYVSLDISWSTASESTHLLIRCR
jgi:ribosomal protein S4